MNYVLKTKLELDKQTAKKRIYDLTEFKNTVKAAVDKYIEKKYAPLVKALKEYDSWNGIKDAYGYDMISKQRYEKLHILYLERNDDFTAQYLNDVLAYIDKQINDTKQWLKDIESQLELMANY